MVLLKRFTKRARVVTVWCFLDQPPTSQHAHGARDMLMSCLSTVRQARLYIAAHNSQVSANYKHRTFALFLSAHQLDHPTAPHIPMAPTFTLSAARAATSASAIRAPTASRPTASAMLPHRALSAVAAARSGIMGGARRLVTTRADVSVSSILSIGSSNLGCPAAMQLQLNGGSEWGEGEGARWIHHAHFPARHAPAKQ